MTKPFGLRSTKNFIAKLEITFEELNSVKFALLKEYENVNKNADEHITRYEANSVILSILAKLDTAEGYAVWDQLQAAEDSKRFPDMEVDSEFTEVANYIKTDKETKAKETLAKTNLDDIPF